MTAVERTTSVSRNPDQNRRSALMGMAALCGLALTGEALAALPRPGTRETYKPIFLAADAYRLTAALAELIIPATDTPGALAAGVPCTIDALLGACTPPQEQQRFTQGLAVIDAAAMRKHAKPFIALTPPRQSALLHALDAGATPFTPEQRAFFVQLKSLTLFAYYTSEAGATRELRYLPVPGGYRGNVALKTIGRRWAL